jgi:Cys-rich repeat protein
VIRTLAAIGIVCVVSCNGDLSLVSVGGATRDGPSDSICRRDLDCRVSSLHCDVVTGSCFPCLTDAHCTNGDLKRCDVATHRCVECGVDIDCGQGRICEPTTRRCVIVCDDAGSSCPSDAPTCDAARGFCVACTNDGACTDGDTRTCDVASGRCVQCRVDTNCPSELPRCEPSKGTCVMCLTSADCTSDQPTCDPGGWECH